MESKKRKLSELDVEIEQLRAQIPVITQQSEFVQQLADIERARQKTLVETEQIKKLQIENLESLFKYEQKEASEIFEFQKANLRSKMIGDWTAKIKRLEDEREGNSAPEAERAIIRKLLRSKSPKGNETERPNANRKHTNHANHPFANVLDESDISKDLKSIFSNWQDHASKFNTKNATSFEADTFAKNGQLHYCDLIVEKGQQIILTSEVIQEDFYGTVATINATEVFVKLEDGRKCRVKMTQLKNGRCSLRLPSDEADE